MRAYANPISLKKLIANLGAGIVSPRSVVVTLDDGYFDALAHAKPLLGRYDIPATLFTISGFIGASRELWWDELQQLCVDAAPTEFDRLYQKLHGAPADEREQMLAGLRTDAKRPVPRRDDYRGLTSEELRSLADGGLIEVGARNSVSLAEIAAHLGKPVQFSGPLEVQEVHDPAASFPDAREVLNFAAALP